MLIYVVYPWYYIFLFFLHAGYEARHIMAISGHKSEASIRSYSHDVSEDKSRDISASLTLATTNSKAVEVYQSKSTEPSGLHPQLFNNSIAPTHSSPSMDILSDLDLPSTPQLNHFINTVLSPSMSSTDILHNNNFHGCTININVKP
jgi:hypothetical protein